MSHQSEVIRLYTKENGTLEYDEKVPCIIFSPIGFMTDGEFKNFPEPRIAVANYLELNKESQSSAKMSTAMFEDLQSAKEWLAKSLNNA